MGWITGPSEFMEAVKTQTSAATHIPTFLMPAGEVALELEEETEEMAKSFAHRRTIMHEGLNSLRALRHLSQKVRSTSLQTLLERA